MGDENIEMVFEPVPGSIQATASRCELDLVGAPRFPAVPVAKLSDQLWSSVPSALERAKTSKRPVAHEAAAGPGEKVMLVSRGCHSLDGWVPTWIVC